MTANDQLTRLIRLAETKTRNNEAIWQKAREGFLLKLQNGTFEVAPEKPERDQGYDLVVKTPESFIVYQIKCKPNDPDYPPVKSLYEAALQSYLASFYGNLENELSKPGVIKSEFASPPPIPTAPTEEQSRRFFTKIQGNWHLDYSRGKENVRIDNEGRYFVIDGPGSDPTTPKFRLKLLDCNSELTRVEIAKDFVKNGRRLHIEVLTVTEKRMEGVATYDQHKLTYTTI